jgi:hypothetical protein
VNHEIYEVKTTMFVEPDKIAVIAALLRSSQLKDGGGRALGKL